MVSSSGFNNCRWPSGEQHVKNQNQLHWEDNYTQKALKEIKPQLRRHLARKLGTQRFFYSFFLYRSVFSAVRLSTKEVVKTRWIWRHQLDTNNARCKRWTAVSAAGHIVVTIQAMDGHLVLGAWYKPTTEMEMVAGLPGQRGRYIAVTSVTHHRSSTLWSLALSYVPLVIQNCLKNL